MAIAPDSPVVAYFDASPAVVEVLALWLAEDGMRVVAGGADPPTDPADVAAFIRTVRPDACIYELRDATRWPAFEALRRALPDRPFLVTTSDRRGLDDLVGVVDGIAILGKPFDLGQLSDTLRSLLARSGSAAPAGVA